VSVATIRNLTVNYGTFTALQDFSVDIAEGCVGLLGPNGAGKTTLIKTLLGFVNPAAGTASVLGSDIIAQPREVRQKVGLMPEQDCHIPGMSAVQFVAYAGELSGMPSEQALRRAHECLEYCGLGEARYRNVETYSTGMKQRIKFAQALVHGPKLLLLDEPTNGLDPAGREDMLALIKDVSHGKGVNVVVSSHLLPDIERVCDEVIVVVGGRLRAKGPMRELRKIEGHPVDIEVREPNSHFIEKLQAAGVALLESRPYIYRVQIPGSPEQLAPLALATAKATGAQIRGFKLAERTLEEAFLDALEGK
jgi:ABC-2 type transport system ATP-binding protein